MSDCKLFGCARPRVSKTTQFCDFHHRRWMNNIPLDAPWGYRRPKKLCTECGDKGHAKGLCRFHYGRMQRGIPFDAPRREPARPCTECGGPHYAKGMCLYHYDKLRRPPRPRKPGRKPYFDFAACGTPAQARKHYRMKIPMCIPCRKAERRYRRR